MWKPESLDQYVFPLDSNVKKAVEEIQRISSGKGGLNSFISVGPRGTGKTTLTQLVAREFDLFYWKINASKDRGIDVIREQVASALTSATEKPAVLVLDEAEALTLEAQRALKALMDDMLPDKILWYICNDINPLIDPIRSRCLILSYYGFDDSAVIDKMHRLLEADLERVESLWSKVKPDIRRLVRALKYGVEEHLTPPEEQAAKLLETFLNLGKDPRKFVSVVYDEEIDYYEVLMSLFPRVSPDTGVKISEYLFRISTDPRGSKVHFLAGLFEVFKDLGLLG